MTSLGVCRPATNIASIWEGYVSSQRRNIYMADAQSDELNDGVITHAMYEVVCDHDQLCECGEDADAMWELVEFQG